MTDHLTSPRTLRSPRKWLAATLLVVAVSAFGCGAAERVPQGLTRLGSGGEEPARRPTVTNLDPALREAVRAATRDAEVDGVRLVITSGWRSREHQQRLFEEAVGRYGSEEEARRYVATPDASAHVTGEAVDIGPTEGDHWLSRHGADYGLCQVFANEIWHFELATTPGGLCPEMLPDSSYRS